ncbi:MAG: class I SAM-dependent methyltransferase [Planktothrix agardhii LY1]|uniref:methyltransferase domain-containing protein n=1 Tax=Planktothrix agardhii TaxID=1160 RepID=UPI002431350D|nr:methyltransferase domain-containing protein [Planktothrix agardhii]MCP9295553.1 class I SAM-dependent methyltransferase [Planktothrix agardhii LY1]
MLVEDENLILSVDESWSDDHAIGLRGWITSKKGALDKVEIYVGGNSVPITSWHPRPDVEAVYPLYYTQNCGFVVHLPRIAKHQVTFNAKGQGKTFNKTVFFDGSLPQPPIDYVDAGDLFNDFINLVNQNHLNVLEIGSRIVSPGSASKRPLFPDSKSYTGFDYYPDSNTDVVGDAHKLSQYFGNQKFDAIFSISVFEHLAMPWIAAREISKIIEVGGITYHSSHFAWPLHEKPWDFWRFSDEGLRVLFSPALGFEIIKSGLFAPLRLHLDQVNSPQELLATQPGFGGVAILAKKVREVNYDKFRWDVTLDEILDINSHYPKPQI